MFSSSDGAVAIPELETERLLLRAWRESDFEAYARICANPEVMRFLGGKAYTRLEAWRHMAYIVGHWQLRGFGHWAVEERASGAFVGRIGVQDPEGWPGFEIGWTIAKECWGRGYATEGARRVLAHVFTDMGREHVISLIHPDNVASLAVARHLGETLEGEATVMGIDVHVYGISRERWLAG
jgi:RimJ/RimL family protein N-acetyltransferase